MYKTVNKQQNNYFIEKFFYALKIFFDNENLILVNSATLDHKSLFYHRTFSRSIFTNLATTNNPNMAHSKNVLVKAQKWVWKRK